MAPLTAPRAADATPAASLPELVRTKHRVFTIPFKLPSPQSPDAATQRVLLSVSTDLGVTWTPAGEAAPNAEAFTYRAKDDGEYWFQLRAIDAKGRSRGGAGPDIRVLVDAAGPKVVARVWKGADGEIMCRYAALDDSLRLESLVVEYRGPGDQAWKKLTADGVLCRESPAHLLGEEIWWAGERIESLTVRISVSDSSGNVTEKQFSLEPTDPHVDQVALARELGAPPLPATDGGSPVPDRIVNAAGASGTGHNRPASTGLTSSTSPLQPPPSRPGQWTPEPATPWAAEGPGSVVARSVGTGPSGPSPMTERAPTVTPTAAGHPPAEYRGKPLQLVRSRRFAWDYEFPSGQSETGPVRVELWSTRDGGVTWQRVAVDNDTTSPINVSLTASGLHGFRLDVVPDLPDVAGGPQPGDAPDCWLGIDDEPPTVELIDVARAQPGEPVGMVIRYAAQDQMLVPDSIRISFAPHAEGPWTTIIDGLGTQGEYRWQPPRTIPAKVHVRVEATDAAGNVGTATSSGPVLVVTPRVVGKLGGVTATPQP